MILVKLILLVGFPGVLVLKNLHASAGDIRDMGSVPGLGRSSERRHDNPLQYSWLENPMDREESGGLHSIGSQRVRHKWSDLAHMHAILLVISRPDCLLFPFLTAREQSLSYFAYIFTHLWEHMTNKIIYLGSRMSGKLVIRNLEINWNVTYAKCLLKICVCYSQNFEECVVIAFYSSKSMPSLILWNNFFLNVYQSSTPQVNFPVT